ncbi:MAG TPA: HEAT repeat domain-containing protein [Acidobacteriota bacterium]|nr:HEAT repeat domain-containing protein [Acidobacteriota bacterium]
MTTTVATEEQRLQDVRLILKDLLKVIKVVSMYPEGNPLPECMRRTFAEKLESLVQDCGSIRITVERDRLALDGETAFIDRSKQESLAGLFFETGITDLTFREGLDTPQIHLFLNVIKDYVNLPNRSRDLVNMLWEAGLTGITFTTVEDLALSEYDGDFRVQELFSNREAGGIEGSQMASERTENYEAIFRPAEQEDADGGPPTGPGRTVFDEQVGDREGLRTVEAANAMGFADLDPSDQRATPDTTLILEDESRLSEEEELQVQQIARDDADFDIYESTTELLRELLHQEGDMASFDEAVTVSEKVMSEFIRAGRLVYAGRVLGYFRSLEERIRPDKPLWSERLKDARITAGSRDRLKILCEALNQLPDIAAADLRRYLNLFDWEALAGLTDLLGELTQRNHRESLCDFLAERGRENLQLVSKGLFDKRWFVVRNSVIILCRIGDGPALNQVKNVVDHEDRRVRLALVSSLLDCTHEQALELLKRGARDKDPEVRKEAVNSIVARRGPAAFVAITDVLNDDSFGELEGPDQQRVLNAYSVLGGDRAVEYLMHLITKPNPLRDRNLRAYRTAAFEALSHNRSERCERALLKLSSSWRPDIKRQAVQALKRRRELIYGGKDD